MAKGTIVIIYTGSIFLLFLKYHTHKHTHLSLPKDFIPYKWLTPISEANGIYFTAEKNKQLLLHTSLILFNYRSVMF